MPPTLALLLCLIFVAALLWIDRSHSVAQSKVVWLPTLWMLYCASRPVSEWLGFEQSSRSAFDIESGNPLERGILSVLIMLGLMILARRNIDWAPIIRNNRWLMILFLYMLISILWSDFQYVSLKRWVKTAGTVVMALVVLSEPDPYEAMRSVFIRTIYILIPLSAVLVKYFPRFGVEYARWSGGATWKGVTLGKNLLGALCLVSALFVISMLVKRSQGNQPPAVRYPKLVYLLILGLTFWLLKGPPGAYSATSIAVLIIGLATFFTMRRLKFLAHYLSRSAYIVLFGVCVVLLLMKLFDVSLLTFASWLGRDTTLTGRTDKIWGVLLPFALKHPVLGVGYGGFWVKLPADLDVGNDFVNQAHNGYLDVFLQLGVVGLILLVPLMISFFNKARSEFERDYEWASLRISFLPVMLLHNLTETSFVASTMLLWNFFVFLMVVHPERPIHELETHASHWETRRTRNETIL